MPKEEVGVANEEPRRYWAFAPFWPLSGLPSIATEQRTYQIDREVPEADSCTAANIVQRDRTLWLVYAYSNLKTRFQSSFMLTTVQLYCFAASSALSSLPKCEFRS